MDMVEDKNPKDHVGINPLSLSLIHDQENVCIEIGDYRIEILNIDENSIEKVKIKKKES